MLEPQIVDGVKVFDIMPIEETYLPALVTQRLRISRTLLVAANSRALLKFSIELFPPHSRARLRALPPVLFAG